MRRSRRCRCRYVVRLLLNLPASKSSGRPMLFNSYEFIFLYLPVVLAGFYAVNLFNRTAAIVWLGGASLFFYGSWNWRFLPLLVGSVVFNYGMGMLLMRGDNQISPRRRLVIVIFAVSANLAALAYYKYANF